MSIEIVTEKDRLYKEHIQKQAEEAEKQANERREKLKGRMESLERRITIRSKNWDNDLKNEYFEKLATDRDYTSLPISSVMASLNRCREAIKDKELELDVIFDRAYKKMLKSGVNEKLVKQDIKNLFLHGRASVASPEYKEYYELYKKADAELLDLQEDEGAYDYCKQKYLRDNKDLIEAERERARMAELRSSGILEELGITQSEGTQNEG